MELKPGLSKLLNKHERSYLTFFKVLFAHPRTIGAALPSSKYLAQEMASHIHIHTHKKVVELGAGTGVITAALLKQGLKPDCLIAIEASSALANELQEDFPEVQIIQGDATQLLKLLGSNSHSVDTIVSSLPLRSLPKEMTQQILEQIRLTLPPGGRYIQFTYSYFKNGFSSLQHYKKVASKRVWLNLPPARVDVFEVPLK